MCFSNNIVHIEDKYIVEIEKKYADGQIQQLDPLTEACQHHGYY